MEPTNNMNNVPETQGPVMPPKPNSSAGSLLAVIIILAVLVIGGFYFWGQSANDESYKPFPQQSTSDSKVDIEADLNATDLDNLDYDLNPDNFNAS